MLDRGRGPERWNVWRPTVDLCRHGDLVVHRLELLHGSHERALVDVVADDIRAQSPETEVRPHVMDFGDPWDFGLVYGTLHDFARGYPFDPDREDYLVHVTTGTHVAQICLFLLTETRYFPARLLQTAPPKRQRSGEPGSYTIIDLDLSKYDRLAARFRQRQREDLSFLKAGIETRSPLFNDLIARIEQVAGASAAPLLLTGPTGAGKSKLARRIYDLKKARQRVTGPFVEVNCATVRGDAAMSTLFGHVRGSFTGAMRDRPGLLRAADGGVLFLDEIGELGTDEQAALLRAIEDKQFLPLGADREVRSNFQLIAGTNADLPAAVRRGRFREDLLARINLWTFRLPGLRERPGGHRAEPRSRAGQLRRRHRRPHHHEQGGAGAVSRLRDVGRGALGRQLPRLQRGAGANGHDRARRPDQPRRGPGRDSAAPRRVAGRLGQRSDRRRSSKRCSRPRRSTPSIPSNGSSSRR